MQAVDVLCCEMRWCGRATERRWWAHTEAEKRLSEAEKRLSVWRFSASVRRISSHSEAVFRLSEAEKRLSVAVSRHTVAVLRHSVMTLTWSVTLGWYLRPSYVGVKTHSEDRIRVYHTTT